MFHEIMVMTNYSNEKGEMTKKWMPHRVIISEIIQVTLQNDKINSYVGQFKNGNTLTMRLDKKEYNRLFPLVKTPRLVKNDAK